MNNAIANVEKLKVVAGIGSDNKLTAYSLSEPLFCIVRDTEEEIKNEIVTIVQTYISYFGDGKPYSVEVSEKSTPDVPVYKIEQIGTISTHLLPNRELAYA